MSSLDDGSQLLTTEGTAQLTSGLSTDLTGRRGSQLLAEHHPIVVEGTTRSAGALPGGLQSLGLPLPWSLCVSCQ